MRLIGKIGKFKHPQSANSLTCPAILRLREYALSDLPDTSLQATLDR